MNSSWFTFLFDLFARCQSFSRDGSVIRFHFSCVNELSMDGRSRFDHLREEAEAIGFPFVFETSLLLEYDVYVDMRALYECLKRWKSLHVM